MVPLLVVNTPVLKRPSYTMTPVQAVKAFRSPYTAVHDLVATLSDAHVYKPFKKRVTRVTRCQKRFGLGQNSVNPCNTSGGRRAGQGHRNAPRLGMQWFLNLWFAGCDCAVEDLHPACLVILPLMFLILFC